VPIQFSCPKCVSDFAVPDERAGMRTKCPKCQNALRVPDLQAETAPTPGPKNASRARLLFATAGVLLLTVLGLTVASAFGLPYVRSRFATPDNSVQGQEASHQKSSTELEIEAAKLEADAFHTEEVREARKASFRAKSSVAALELKKKWSKLFRDETLRAWESRFGESMTAASKIPGDEEWTREHQRRMREAAIAGADKRVEASIDLFLIECELKEERVEQHILQTLSILLKDYENAGPSDLVEILARYKSVIPDAEEELARAQEATVKEAEAAAAGQVKEIREVLGGGNKSSHFAFPSKA
jgi:hypothetical protein